MLPELQLGFVCMIPHTRLKERKHGGTGQNIKLVIFYYVCGNLCLLIERLIPHSLFVATWFLFVLLTWCHLLSTWMTRQNLGSITVIEIVYLPLYCNEIPLLLNFYTV